MNHLSRLKEKYIFQRCYSQNSINALRGTKDMYGKDIVKYTQVVDTSRKIASLYGYQEISTPIIEDANLYLRNLGENSDIIALRPENTAGVVRAYISNNMHSSSSNPMNLFYHGPMFRHERPQKGRLRQFHQIGIESLGDPSPYCEVFQIALAYHLLSEWRLENDVILQINTLGDTTSRKKYSEVLTHYFNEHKSQLSEDSKLRLERGSVLRILDSKDSADFELIYSVPKYFEFLNAESKERWAQVKEGLDQLGLKYTCNNNLVRGLDYYTHTCFEFTSTKLGSQSAVIAGGRYDELVNMVGGGDVPGSGWALGIERLLLMMSQDNTSIDEEVRAIAVVPILEENNERTKEIMEKSTQLCQKIRFSGMNVFFVNPTARNGKHMSLKKQLSLASEKNCSYALIIGLNEVNSNHLTVKDLDSRRQKSFPLDSFDNISNLAVPDFF